MLQAVAVFLVAVAVMAVAGRLRRPRVPPRRTGTAVEAARKCPACGAYVIGARPEACARPDCPHRRA